MIKDGVMNNAPERARSVSLEPPPPFEEVTAGPVPQAWDSGTPLSDSVSAPNSRVEVATDVESAPAAYPQSPRLDGNIGTGASPPPFSEYVAEAITSGSGDIVSHDPHLNKDGEALYRFLLNHLEPPRFRLHCCGSHSEERVRTIYRSDGSSDRRRASQEAETVTVVDFDFYIDLTHFLVTAGNPEIFTLADSEPAYRGRMYQEVENIPVFLSPHEVPPLLSFWDKCKDIFTPNRRIRLDDEESRDEHNLMWRKAARRERKSAERLRKALEEQGRAPWAVQFAPEEQLVDGERRGSMLSRLTVRAWADDYCSSEMVLKDFTFTKVVYGWELGTLKEGGGFPSILFRINIDIFHSYLNKINIRPDNRLSRALSTVWIVVVLWCLLIYPFIWLWRRFSQRGGGYWDMCGAAYALKRQDDPSAPRVDVTVGAESFGWRSVTKTLGAKEGEWFKDWEATILNAVRCRTQSSTPLERRRDARQMLDGYSS
ncbi:uncharacterized protein EI90DRAFT_2973348 [Cantharellus anzutake]|uniref:uncharacterized protein n=1 Tax=Cantharellus anzutake TaxID=1750568 RepID=UPI001908D0B3|nr:uncharacterized protein EI90DRAFT_2973348 [Cantharellus anzutake]KAF8329687.1 hypothetical protein EI90DRAFT_2973348 [Cantharellus anzutake]